MLDTYCLAVWAPTQRRTPRPGQTWVSHSGAGHSSSDHHHQPPSPTKKPPTTVHVLVSLKCFFSKLHILSKLFAHITAICVQGSLKQVRVWKAMESTRGSEIHKPGKAMNQREAALLCSSKLKSTQGDRAAAACLGWFLST